MIKHFEKQYLDQLMDIWLDTNISAHPFIHKSHWETSYDMVRRLLPSSDIFIYQEENAIKGFAGITDDFYIAGLFIKELYQAQGIGSKLLDYYKKRYPRLELDVFIKNEHAVRFYLKNEFTIAETKTNYDFKQKEYHMTWSRKHH